MFIGNKFTIFSHIYSNNNGHFSRGGRYCCLYKASKPNIKHIYYYALFTFVALIDSNNLY